MESKSTLLREYKVIKAKYPEALLLFRVGEFYESFNEDAQAVAEILDIPLTEQPNNEEFTKCAGFRYSLLYSFLPKLVKAGHRLAICDKLEAPKLAEKTIKREISDVVK